MAYDGLDRLTNTTSPMFGTASYVYDALDNLTQVSLSGGSLPRTQYYCYTASNQVAFVRSGPQCTGNASPALTALTYDLQGNLASKNGTGYTFDYGNRLRSTAGQSYRYDADGRRVRQDSAGTSLKYSYYAKDGRLLWQRDEPNSKRINNVYLAGSLLAEITRPIGSNAPTISYFHTDALGSPIAKTNAAGAIIETSEYEPYGRLLNRNNDDRAGYTGHVMDAVSGLTYMQQRYYDPQIGRFLSVDPVTANSVTGSNFNRYNYAANNPYKFTDPDGRQSARKHKDNTDEENEKVDQERARRQSQGQIGSGMASSGPVIPNPNGVVDGGPWEPRGPSSGDRPGSFQGPKPEGGGPRRIVQWVPPEGQGGPPGSSGYWKINQPGGGWQRFDPAGKPITAQEAHPNNRGTRNGLEMPSPMWLVKAWVFTMLMTATKDLNESEQQEIDARRSAE